MNQTSTILAVCGVARVVLTLVVLLGFLALGAGGSIDVERNPQQETYVPTNEPPVDGLNRCGVHHP
jgi:hypothetical protein